MIIFHLHQHSLHLYNENQAHSLLVKESPWNDHLKKIKNISKLLLTVKRVIKLIMDRTQ